MLRWAREGFSSLNIASKLLLLLMNTMSGVNVYGFFEAWSIGSVGRAWSHLIYAITLFLLNVVILYSSVYLTRGREFYKEAKSLYSSDCEEKRMAMYEKLLETKEKEIQ